jgi:2-methylcitrate synthase
LKQQQILLEANYNKFIKIFAKTPTAVAANFRTRKGLDIIDPKKDLSFSENFFHMCFGKIPSKDVIKAFDVSVNFICRT